MGLKLEIAIYKEFYGSNVEQMPLLIAEGRVPMSVSQLMQRRLNLRNDSEVVKTAWMENFFDTGDAIVYHPNGDVKIVLDSQTLREMTLESEMTPQSQRNCGALILDEDVYKTLQGEVFKKGKFGKVEDPMSRKDVKAHPVWKVLARDQALLNDYADFIFAESKERCDCDTTMPVYPGSCGGDKPEMRTWSVGKLGHRCYVNGGNVLDHYEGRLVGISKPC
jgi:hypothetical protein